MRVALFAAALIMSAPALAEKVAPGTDTPAAGAATAEKAAEPKEEKKICRRAPASESRLGGKKICMTAKQWKQSQSD